MCVMDAGAMIVTPHCVSDGNRWELGLYTQPNHAVKSLTMMMPFIQDSFPHEFTVNTSVMAMMDMFLPAIS